MTTISFPRRVAKTGRPLGLVDVLSKVVETGFRAAQAGLARRAALRQTPPVKSTPKAIVRESAALRRLADRHRHSSPGFASDLYAAADLHEKAGGL